MLKKILSGFALLVSVLLIILSFLFGRTPKNLIFATDTPKLTINSQEYDLPVNLFFATYNPQSDTATIYRDQWGYLNGIPREENKVWISHYYSIYDQSSLNEVIQILNLFIFSVEQEAYDLYEADALCADFIIIADNPDAFSEGEVLNDSTISGLKLHNEDIIDIPIPINDSFTMSIADLLQPVISGYEGVYITNVDDPISIENIKSHIRVIDDVDGDISNRIIITSDTYTDNMHVVGIHPIIMSATDTAGNTSSITINVSVVDATLPTFSGVESINSPLSAPLTINDIKETQTANDNYDGVLTSSITIHQDQFSANKSLVGNYAVTLKVSDSSGNIAFKTINVAVIDDIKPLISGSSSYTKATSAVLTMTNIMDNLVATDNVDGNLNSQIHLISDTYSAHKNVVGTYSIIFDVTDAANNTSDQFTVTIIVKDLSSPVFYIDDSIINTSSYNTLSHENIITFLSQSGQIDSARNPTVTFISDEYSENASNPGIYRLSAKVSYDNGESKVINLSIKVNDGEKKTEELIEEPVVIEKISFFKKVINWFSKVGEIMSSFFINAWVWIKTKLFAKAGQ